MGMLDRSRPGGTKWTILLVGLLVISQAAQGSAEAEAPHPSESECRPFIEAALKEKDHATEAPPPSAEDAVLDETASTEQEAATDIEIPDNLRDKRHVHNILKLDEDDKEEEELLAKTIETTLKELKRLYDNAIKPLEMTYKYRDLSNRHFGDPEIFSKPLVLFMGPWSGGKSSIINYLLDNEYSHNSLRTGAEPSPAYFNILSWGESPTVLDGTQLAADWTFSGLQKFGQGLLDRLRGLQLPHPLLEKINIVEIPGILEIRKQVERQFPFNDACQWFIDRADIIFLVYDPSKLDVVPETEAILDQLKGREYQTRIILNKADQVRPEELMRVQGTLIWNISPLMSSAEPPVMYSASLWSNPYELGAPIRLLQAQEHAFLRDLRHAIVKRVENKIASARRFAVRVRNHAKMVDCYLTTYYNHKTFFGNRKQISDDIIEHPQNYHIYAGLSTLTNISRYDLPDPEVYRDFFRLNPVFEFKKLSDTCTYFRGCPINRLDVAIAYDLPELVGKYKKSAETLLKQREAAKEKAAAAKGNTKS
uniref:Sarcalumenin n=1 Tax=Cacopsylla melanoneura TaxID=428564 RepID=A0A8D8RD22_9HEMI